MSSNIVHQYFKKEIAGIIIMVKVNPIQWKGTELTISSDGAVEERNLAFDEEIFANLEADGFVAANPLEFNLYASGLAK